MLKAIQKELVLRKQELEGKKLETIYFGGGTPSVLTADELIGILETIGHHYGVVDTMEITLEANPDDLSLELVRDLSTTPINRLSVGIQSFFDSDLALMNRAHNADDAKKCLALAANFFENISVDLIYGIPGLDDARWQRNIEAALDFDVPHISAYALTVEPKTALEHLINKGDVARVDEEQAERQYLLLATVLEQKGYVNYELSNFGKTGFFSRNNTAYWQGKSYLGIGPSAHSYNGGQRGWSIRNNAKYIKDIEQGRLPMEWENLTTVDRYNEYVMTGLRTIWGVSLQKIRMDFGATYERYLLKQAAKYVDEQLLHWDNGVLLPTKKGKFLTDGMAADLFMINLKS